MDWILMVDDEEESRVRVSSILKKEDMRVTTLSSGRELFDYIEGMTPLPDLILLDVYMPEMDGFEILTQLHKRMGDRFRIPVIFLTGNEDIDAETKGFKLGAVDYIRKPFLPEILTMRVKRTLELDRLRKDLAREVDKKVKENMSLTLHVVQTLAETIDAKDTYTNGHSGRVAAYSRMIARRMGYDEYEQDEIYIIALLHDVGKIGVPDWIINKTDRLTDEEFSEIKKHPEMGNRILKNIKEMPKLAYGARWHHERFDGRGYPDGLKGLEIPEEARIIAVADAYDAMTSNRSYRSLMPQADVRRELEKGKGGQFDPDIADIMISMIDEDKAYTMRERTDIAEGKDENSAQVMIGNMDAEIVLPDEISKIEQIDTALGLFMCGDVEDYLEALYIFAGSISSKAQKIEASLVSGDIESFMTLVHSLKSSARTIGATDISNLAKRLETAAKKGDMPFISEKAPELLSEYRALEQPLGSLGEN